jgi:hypothetical protein
MVFIIKTIRHIVCYCYGNKCVRCRKHKCPECLVYCSFYDGDICLSCNEDVSTKCNECDMVALPKYYIYDELLCCKCVDLWVKENNPKYTNNIKFKKCLNKCINFAAYSDDDDNNYELLCGECCTACLYCKKAVLVLSHEHCYNCLKKHENGLIDFDNFKQN